LAYLWLLKDYLKKFPSFEIIIRKGYITIPAIIPHIVPNIIVLIDGW
jgi:hypothetical protein